MMMTRLVSILLSFFLLASQISLTIGTHYCRGQAVDTKILIGEAHLGCGMADMDESCDVSGTWDLSYNTPTCCENHYEALPASDDFLKDAPHLNVIVGLIAALADPVLSVELLSKKAHQSYIDYLPPPLEKDVQVLFQTFKI